MKISIQELKKVISEAIDRKLQESGVFGIDWNKMRELHAVGKLKGNRWHLIMTAVEEAGDPEKALALLKSAVATLELHKSKNPAPSSSHEQPSEAELTDMNSPDML